MHQQYHLVLKNILKQMMKEDVTKSGNDDDDKIYFIPEAGKYYTENGLYCLK